MALPHDVSWDSFFPLECRQWPHILLAAAQDPAVLGSAAPLDRKVLSDMETPTQQNTQALAFLFYFKQGS